MIEIVLKSLVSAVITGVILLIAKFGSPKLAGAIGGVPIVFAISYVLVTMEDRAKANSFMIGGMYGTIATVVFIVGVLVFNKYFPDYHWVNFAVAYVFCFLTAVGMVQYND